MSCVKNDQRFMSENERDNMAEEFKKQGNDAFSAGKFDEAIGFFSQAIEIDPSNHVL
jgi:hypothetical protein